MEGAGRGGEGREKEEERDHVLCNIWYHTTYIDLTAPLSECAVFDRVCISLKQTKTVSTNTHRRYTDAQTPRRPHPHKRMSRNNTWTQTPIQRRWGMCFFVFYLFNLFKAM